MSKIDKFFSRKADFGKFYHILPVSLFFFSRKLPEKLPGNLRETMNQFGQPKIISRILQILCNANFFLRINSTWEKIICQNVFKTFTQKLQIKADKHFLPSCTCLFKLVFIDISLSLFLCLSTLPPWSKLTFHHNGTAT